MTTRRRSRPGRRLPSALVLLLLAALSWTSPAAAAEEIGLSRDGVVWTPDLAVPLFESSIRWVPGDDVVQGFQVRNQGPSAATMTIEALSRGGDPVLAADVAFSVRVDDGPWTPLDLGVPSQSLTVRPVAVGETAAVDVRAVFDPASSNPTQNLVLPVTLRITLSGDLDTDVGSGGGTPPGAGTGAGTRDLDGSGSGLLPRTGATIGPGSLLVALFLCVSGALIIARRRGTEEAHRG